MLFCILFCNNYIDINSIKLNWEKEERKKKFERFYLLSMVMNRKLICFKIISEVILTYWKNIIYFLFILKWDFKLGKSLYLYRLKK